MSRRSDTAASTDDAPGEGAASGRSGGQAPAVPESNPVSALNAYELRHLPTHLSRASRPDDLHRLLRLEYVEGEETGRGRRHNAWYEAKDDAGDEPGFEQDVLLAWAAADEAFQAAAPAEPGSAANGNVATERGDPTDRAGAAVGLQWRYALTLASMNAKARNIAPALTVAMVERGFLDPRDAFDRATTMSDGTARGAVLAGIAPHAVRVGLATNLVDEALALSGPARFEVLRSAARTVPIDLLPRLLDASTTLESPSDQARLLEAIAGRRPGGDIADRLVTGALELADATRRAEALRAIVPALSDPQLDSLVSRIAARPPRGRAVELASIVAVVPERQIGTVLDALRATPVDEAWALAVGQLLPRLTPTMGDDAATEARSRIAGVRQTAVRCELFAAAGFVDEALALAPTVEDPKARTECMCLVAERLDAGTKRTVLRDVTRLNGMRRATCLRLLAPYLPASSFSKALDLAVDLVGGRDARTVALTAVAGHAPESSLDHVLDVALRVPSIDQRAAVLAALAPRLNERQLRVAMRTVSAQRSAGTRPKLLAALGGALDAAALRRAVETSLRLAAADERADAVAALAPYLPDDLLTAAATELREIGDADDVAEALVALLPRHPAGVVEAWMAIPEMRSPARTARAIGGLAAYGDARTAAQALEVLRLLPADTLEQRGAIGAAEALLLARLSELGNEREWSETEAAVGRIPWPDKRAKAWSDLMGRLPAADQERCIAHALAEITSMEPQASIVWLAPELHGPLRAKALLTAYELLIVDPDGGAVSGGGAVGGWEGEAAEDPGDGMSFLGMRVAAQADTVFAEAIATLARSPSEDAEEEALAALLRAADAYRRVPQPMSAMQAYDAFLLHARRRATPRREPLTLEAEIGRAELSAELGVSDGLPEAIEEVIERLDRPEGLADDELRRRAGRALSASSAAFHIWGLEGEARLVDEAIARHFAEPVTEAGTITAPQWLSGSLPALESSPWGWWSEDDVRAPLAVALDREGLRREADLVVSTIRSAAARASVWTSFAATRPAAERPAIARLAISAAVAAPAPGPGVGPSAIASLGGLGPHVSSSVAADAVDAVVALADGLRPSSDPDELAAAVCEALGGLVGFIPAPVGPERTRYALGLAGEIRSIELRERAVALLARIADGEASARWRELVAGLDRPDARVRALVARGMAVLARGDAAAAAELAAEAIANLVAAEPGGGATPLAEVASLLRALPRDHAMRLWARSAEPGHLLRERARATRAELLEDLLVLAPAMEQLGGQPAIAGAVAAISDVAAWWP